jgi:hypothetical protein
MMYILGQLVENQKTISKTLDVMSENLKTLNDQNVLHDRSIDLQHSEVKSRLDGLSETIKTWVNRNFWLVIILLVALLVALGLKETFTVIPKLIGSIFA